MSGKEIIAKYMTTFVFQDNKFQFWVLSILDWHQNLNNARTPLWQTFALLQADDVAGRASSTDAPAQESKVRGGGGLNPGSTQVRTLGLDQRGGRPNINIKNLGSTQVQPRFNPGSTQVEPRFNPSSTQV